MSDATIDWRLRAIARMYRLVHATLPTRGLKLEVQSEAVALGPDVVEAMVREARSGRVPHLSRGMLAVATLYGPRLAELCGIGMAQVDVRHHRIDIPTVKNSVRRWQPIPADVLYAGPAPGRRPGRRAGAGHFPRLLRAALIPAAPGSGWHAIRRALAMGLRRQGASLETIMAFMRWKREPAAQGAIGDPTAMARHYAEGATAVVTLGGRSILTAEALQAADLDAFAHHPFLHFWRS